MASVLGGGGAPTQREAPVGSGVRRNPQFCLRSGMYGTLQCRVLLVWVPPGLRNGGTERAPSGRRTGQHQPRGHCPAHIHEPEPMDPDRPLEVGHRRIPMGTEFV